MCASPACKAKRIGVEMAFLPADAAAALRDGLADSEIKDALFVLERLRAKKRPDELAMLRKASELVVDSMKAVIAKAGPGMTKQEQFETLRREEVNRGLTFEYLLLTAGTSLNRAPSDYKLAKGDIMSLDSGGNYHGYIGDLCRMAILGEPDAELEDLLGEIEMIQRAAMKPIKAGAIGGGDLRRRRAAGARNRSTPSTCTSWRTAWASSATRRRASTARSGLRRLRRRAAARSRHGDLGRDHAEAPQARLHQARGHRGGHRHRLRDLRRGRPRLEPRGDQRPAVSAGPPTNAMSIPVTAEHARGQAATRAWLLPALFVWFAAMAWLRPLALPDEGRYVGVALEMLWSGDWLVPTARHAALLSQAAAVLLAHRGVARRLRHQRVGGAAALAAGRARARRLPSIYSCAAGPASGRHSLPWRCSQPRRSSSAARSLPTSTCS